MEDSGRETSMGGGGGGGIKPRPAKLAFSVSEVPNLSFRYALQLLRGLAPPSRHPFLAYSFVEEMSTQQFVACLGKRRTSMLHAGAV